MQQLNPATADNLWRVSPATFAAHLTRNDPKPWIPAPHLLLLSKWIVEVATGRKSRVIVNCPPRHGKPLDSTTSVLMRDGFSKQLKDIVVGDYVITDKGRPRRVLAVHEQGLLPCVRIASDCGREVTAALDHPFLTARGWMNAGELTNGDVLALVPKSQTTSSDPDRPIADFRLAGYFVGDGSVGISKTGVQSCNITCFDEESARDIEFQAEVKGWKWHWSKAGRIDFTRGVTGAGTVKDGPREWLRATGLAGKTAHCKEVPEWVFGGTQEQIAEFLSAYFLCDGTINHKGQNRRDGCFEFYSVSKKLLAGVRHLLLRVGVGSRLRAKKGRYKGQPHWSWRLSITGVNDLAEFIDCIRLMGHKLSKAVSWGARPNRFQSEYKEDGVVEVERVGERECRCLTVEEDETFLANDFVVHNSELISKWTTPWYLDRWPHKEIINAGYSNAFSRLWGVKARAIIQQHADKMCFSLGPESRAGDRWNTTKGGGMCTAGTEGQLTGKGANLFIIDDPIKDAAEANSPLERERVWQWWLGTASTRLNDADAGVILCMTRWHHDDLAGRLIEAGIKGDGEKWEVLNLPAIAVENDPLGRRVGEALWPAIVNTRTKKSLVKFPIEALLAIKNRNAEVFAAQYQGVPANTIGAGDVYKHFAPANMSRDVRFDPRYPIVWALDFNVNPMSAIVGQIAPVQTPMSFLLTGNLREFRVLQELVLEKSDTLSMCRAFQERTEQYLDQLPPGGRKLIVHVYGDRSGQSNKTSGQTDYEVIKDYFTGAHDYFLVMKLSRKNPRVKDRTNAVNMLLCNGAGQRRMVIHESCEELRKDFEQLKWRTDSAGNSLGDINKKADSKRSHISDALGYAVEKEFSLTAGGDIMQSGIAQ